MSSNKIVKSFRAMNTQTVAASGTGTSLTVDLNDLECTGSISVQYIITGDGTCTIEWQQTSIGNSPKNATNFVKPSSGYTLATGLTDTSGTGSNGEDVLSLPTSPGNFLQLVVTETGTSNSVIVTLIVSCQ